MRKVSAKLRVTTPLFMGGAQKGSPELRAASFKGLLRFWFRALRPGRFEEESRIFGNASDVGGTSNSHEGLGQSLFLLQAREVSLRVVKVQSGGQTWNGGGLSYLGYGVTEGAGRGACKPTRGYLAPDSTFSLDFIFHPRATPDDIQWVLRSLWALCFFGGAGSRSRRGFGSLELERLDATGVDVGIEVDVDVHVGVDGGVVPAGIQTAEEIVQVLSARIMEWCAPLPNVKPDHTAFCRGTRIVVAQPNGSWNQALDYIGSEMLNYRSYRGERNFPIDHDVVRGFLSGEKTREAPCRVVFGLPHNYYFTSLPKGRRKAAVAAADSGRKPIDRRASPLFIHIHPIGRGQGRRYVPVLTLFPAEFLPDGARITVSDEHQRTVSVPAPGESQGDYSPIEGFLERVENQGGAGVTL